LAQTGTSVDTDREARNTVREVRDAIRVSACHRPLVAVAACARGIVHKVPSERRPTAQEILDSTAATYASAMSYADRGRLTAVYRSARGRSVERLTFATAFDRAGEFVSSSTLRTRIG
jgi:hypothetical protein